MINYWALLRVHPGKQQGYLNLLEEFYPEIETYFPRHTVLSRRSGMRKAIKVLKPVYPGYVFIKVGNKEVDHFNMRVPVQLPVVARWVKFGGVVELVPGIVIARLKELERKNELVKKVCDVCPFVPGMRVRVCLAIGQIQADFVHLCTNKTAVVDTKWCLVTVNLDKLEQV
jgi:hypothetical protein